MAYNKSLAEKVRNQLLKLSTKKIIEKKMFGGLAFIIDKKMCINISGENLMCRFDPILEEKVQSRKGYLPMKMKGKLYKGYCYVEKIGFKTDRHFYYWINLCVDFNEKAKSSKNN